MRPRDPRLGRARAGQTKPGQAGYRLITGAAWPATSGRPSTAQPSGRDAVTEARVGAAAAEAARATPGVVRLQPGLWGLVRQLTQQILERAAGEAGPDLGGVEVQLDDGAALVELTLVTDGRRQAATVVAAVQRSVADAVTVHTGLVVHRVAVHVCEIDITYEPHEPA